MWAYHLNEKTGQERLVEGQLTTTMITVPSHLLSRLAVRKIL